MITSIRIYEMKNGKQKKQLESEYSIDASARTASRSKWEMFHSKGNKSPKRLMTNGFGIELLRNVTRPKGREKGEAVDEMEKAIQLSKREYEEQQEMERQVEQVKKLSEMERRKGSYIMIADDEQGGGKESKKRKARQKEMMKLEARDVSCEFWKVHEICKG